MKSGEKGKGLRGSLRQSWGVGRALRARRGRSRCAGTRPAVPPVSDALTRGKDSDIAGLKRTGAGAAQLAAIAESSAGAIVAARAKRVPVLVDGYVACAAAAVLQAHDKNAIAHCVAGHVAAEGAHAEVLHRLGKRPLIDLGMRLGEASGAALAVGIVKAALACHRDMATFAGASIEKKIES